MKNEDIRSAYTASEDKPNYLRGKIMGAKESLGVSSYWIAKKCTNLCNETVYAYLRGTSDGSGKTISSIMDAVKLKVVPLEEREDGKGEEQST